MMGIPTSLIMTVFVMRQNRKTMLAIGTQDKTQLLALNQALRTATVPDDPAIRKLLPAYLDRRHAQAQRFMTYAQYIFMIALAIYSLSIMGSHTISELTLLAFMISFGVACYRATQKMTDRIKTLYQKLSIQPRAPAKQSFNMERFVTKGARLLFEFAVGMLGLTMVVTPVALAILQPQLNLFVGLCLPLIIAGLFIFAPYYVLRGRWAMLYAGLLTAVVTWAIYRLHVPIGAQMIAPADIPFNRAIDTVLEGSFWLALHATNLIIFATILILLDLHHLQAKKTNKIDRTLGEWASVTAVVAAFAFIIMPAPLYVQERSGVTTITTTPPPSVTTTPSETPPTEDPVIHEPLEITGPPGMTLGEPEAPDPYQAEEGYDPSVPQTLEIGASPPQPTLELATSSRSNP